MLKKQHVIFYVPTLEGGGAEKVFVNLANFFVRKNYTVFYVCAYGNSYSHLLDKRVQVKRCFNQPIFKSKILNTFTRVLCMPFFITSLLAKNRNAHLFTSVLESDMLGNIVHFLTASKGKLIISQAGLIDDVTHPGVLSPFLKWAFQRAYKIVANSPETKKTILDFYSLCNKKIELIGNPVYEKKKITQNHFENSYLLNVGRFESQKDHHTLLKAFKLVLHEVDIRLKLLGEGVLREELELLSRDLGIQDKVDFEGFVESPESYYEHATVFVLSSTHETFANVLVEAMAYGIPVVSTNCGGPSYIINNTSIGELVPIKDHKQLAIAILKVIKNPGNYNRETIISRAQDFSIESIGNKYLSLLQ